jgi:GntR family carbon starvation induced transcriptional regulator
LLSTIIFMLHLVESSSTETEGPRSQTSFAYGQLRADILAGRYAPGERLKISDLAKALEVSPGAIREALSRLVPDQLVVSRDQKGFTVAPLSVEDLEDLTDLRCEIEAIALRRSVEHGGPDWEGTVLAAAHRLRRTQIVSETDHSLTADWVERHAAFHMALVSACDSPRLITLHAQLYEQSERYRGLSVLAQSEEKRDVATEHQAIVDAALDRDADRLIGLVLTHFRRTTALIVDAARKSSAGDRA